MRGGDGSKKGRCPSTGRGGARSLQRTTYSNKGCGQKATSQAIEKSAELAPSRWLFGPENDISGQVLGDFLQPVRLRMPRKSVSVPKIRFGNNGDEVRRGRAPIRCGLRGG